MLQSVKQEFTASLLITHELLIKSLLYQINTFTIFAQSVYIPFILASYKCIALKQLVNDMRYVIGSFVLIFFWINKNLQQIYDLFNCLKILGLNFKDQKIWEYLKVQKSVIFVLYVMF